MPSINGSTLRLTGMASGMDTESIVNDLLSVSKLKIEAAKKQKVLLEWKRDAYKDVAKKLSSFQSKYFGANASSSLIGSSVKKLSATHNSPYISVTPGENTAKGSIYIADIISLASSAKLSSSQAVSANPAITINADNLSELSGKGMVVNLNGISKTITFSDKTYSSASDVQTELVQQLTNAFGSDKIQVALDGDKLSLSSANSTLRISVPTDAGINPTGILDFASYSSNRLDFNMSLASAGLAKDVFVSEEDTALSFSINGVDFTMSGEKTMYQIMNAVNESSAGVRMTYSSLTDTFSLTATESGASSGIEVVDNHGFLMEAMFGTGKYTAGTNAVVQMSTNGSTNEADLVTVTRSTNSFSIDGSTVTLLGKAAGEAQESITVNYDYDVNSIASEVKKFVDDYNELLASITSKTSEEVYRDYLPLTDDEKEELSESEIELWTNKAKSGILRNDSYLKAIETELRRSIYTQVESLDSGESGLGLLAQIGITTGLYSEKGKLYFDESKLKAALGEDPEKVLGILTQSSSVSYSAYATTDQQNKRFAESGVLWRLSDVMAKNLSTIGKKGALITLVGSPNDSYNTETEYSKRIQDADDRIDRMNEKLKDEEERYWSRFTAMETALSKLNSQSSWLTSMMSQGSK